MLELDENNVKALYRRGQCNLIINELEDALADFQKVSMNSKFLYSLRKLTFCNKLQVIQLEPSNKAAANHVVICKQKIKQNKDKEKKLYANMFTKLAAGSNEVE